MKRLFLRCVLWGAVLPCLLVGVRAGAEPATDVPQAPAPQAIKKESPPGYANDVKVEALLQTSTTVDGQPIVYPSGTPELRAVLVELASGAETGWHTHPTPCVGYILSGQISVEIKGKGAKTYRAGECLAETVNTLHNGTNTGDGPVRILMVVVGEQGSPTAERPTAR